MAKCPECSAEIDSLDAVVNERTLYTYKRNGDKVFIEEIEFDIQYFKCPLCYKQLDIGADEDSACDFLKGE